MLLLQILFEGAEGCGHAPGPRHSKGHTNSLREYLLTRQQQNPSGLKWSPAWLETVTLIITLVDKILQLVTWKKGG